MNGEHVYFLLQRLRSRQGISTIDFDSKCKVESGSFQCCGMGLQLLILLLRANTLLLYLLLILCSREVSRGFLQVTPFALTLQSTHSVKFVVLTFGNSFYYPPRSNPAGVAVKFRCFDPVILTHVDIKHFDRKNWDNSCNKIDISSCSMVPNSSYFIGLYCLNFSFELSYSFH